MKKRILSLFICLTICLSLSAGSLAADDIMTEHVTEISGEELLLSEQNIPESLNENEELHEELSDGQSSEELEESILQDGLLEVVFSKELGSACEHVVNCDNRSACIKCDRTDLSEEEISEVVHPYAFCYDLTKCGFCGETIPEGSVETEHTLQTNTKYIPDEDGHRVTCFCGAMVDTHVLSHVVLCNQEDRSVCNRCGAHVENIEIDHSGETLFQDETYHWYECVDCGMTLSPKVNHATYCDDPDGPCVTCGRPNDQCIIYDEYRGMHNYMYSPDRLIEVDGEYIHYRYCDVCETELVYHHGIICNDYGSDVRHGVVCAECGRRFNDMKHGEKVLYGTIEATCTKKGYTGDEICIDCGHIFEEGSEIDALGHEFEDGICTRCGARESSCEHIVNCDDRTVCIVCGMTELIEEEISEVQHLYAFCYNSTTCAYCHEPIEAGSVLETMHLLDMVSGAKFYPVGDMHRVTCHCGEVSGEELLPHQIICTQEDKSVCDLCGGEAGDNPYVVHFGDEIPMHDENCHWVICGNCGENVSGNSKHYTSCTNPDATECAFCGVSTDECVIEGAYHGLHDNPYLLDERLIEEDGEYIHYCYCYACDTQVAYHHGIICNDYGDDVDHGVVCAECGHRFDDMKHGKTVTRGAKKATCTKKGYTGDEVCEDCGHIFKESSEIDALGHEFEDGICTRCGARESSCQHIVTCEDRTVCIVCGMEELIEEEISEVVHPYAFCYDLTKCGACGETIEEGSVETVHSLDVNVKYIPDEYVHWTTCFCGEVMDEEPFEHFAVCTQEDTSVCFRCGAQVEGIEVDHIHRQEYQDEVYHWVGCLDCGEEVVPKVKHYTYCYDPDGPCEGCGRPNDQCIFDDENRGIHDAFTAPDQLIEVDGEYVHYCYCRMCETEVTYHRGIVCEDFGDADTHKVACAVCGHTFNDMEHGERVIRGAKKATCTKKGYTGDEVCEDCGHVFKKGSAIKALGHEYENGKCVRCGTAIPNEENTQVIKLGTSGLIMVADASYAAGETADEGPIATYKSNVYDLSFDIYQWEKAEGETLNGVAAEEAAGFNVECVETEFNDIPAVYYESAEEKEGKEQPFLAVLTENEDSFVKIVFWINGADADGQVEAMVNTIAAEEKQ